MNKMNCKKIFSRAVSLTCLILTSGSLVLAVGRGDADARFENQAAQSTKTDGIKNPVYLSEKETKDSATKKVLPKSVSIRGKHSIKIRVTISRQGNVEAAEIISGKPILAVAAQQASSEWKFKPFKKNKNSAQFIGVITYIFSNNRVEIF